MSTRSIIVALVCVTVMTVVTPQTANAQAHKQHVAASCQRCDEFSSSSGWQGMCHHHEWGEEWTPTTDFEMGTCPGTGANWDGPCSLHSSCEFDVDVEALKSLIRENDVLGIRSALARATLNYNSVREELSIIDCSGQTSIAVRIPYNVALAIGAFHREFFAPRSLGSLLARHTS